MEPVSHLSSLLIDKLLTASGVINKILKGLHPIFVWKFLHVFQLGSSPKSSCCSVTVSLAKCRIVIHTFPNLSLCESTNLQHTPCRQGYVLSGIIFDDSQLHFWLASALVESVEQKQNPTGGAVCGCTTCGVMDCQHLVAATSVSRRDGDQTWDQEANKKREGAFLRKPADRLGKVVLANEVSIRGSGGWSSRVARKSRN